MRGPLQLHQEYVEDRGFESRSEIEWFADISYPSLVCSYFFTLPHLPTKFYSICSRRQIEPSAALVAWRRKVFRPNFFVLLKLAKNRSFFEASHFSKLLITLLPNLIPLIYF
jgi:hypothetical protein